MIPSFIMIQRIRMTQPDSIQFFIFEEASIRGKIAHLNQTYLKIINQRPYPPKIRQLLGEALISSLLITATIKFQGELSLQFFGDHRFPLLVVQCNDALNLRAFAKYQENLTDSDYEAAFLNGSMAITVKTGPQAQAYRSVVPILSLKMSENLMSYFAQSEQISTYIWLATEESGVAGLCLQLMPDAPSIEREQFWEYAIKIGETIKPEELLHLSNTVLLHRLYHETELRLYDLLDVQFLCRCDLDRIKEVLKVLGEKDLQKLLKEQGVITVTCDFCQSLHHFDEIDLKLLFKN